MVSKQNYRVWPQLWYLILFLVTLFAPQYLSAQTSSTAPLVQSNNLKYLGSFKLPNGNLGSTYGFSYAGTGGLGTYAVTFNPANKSLFIGGHPYEQKVAEIAIPQSFLATPTAIALQSLIDPFEGKLGTINPSDPNSKIIGSSFVYNNQLFLAGFSYYDGAATQVKSQFVRPTNLSTKGKVEGPFTIGDKYPGWVNKYASIIPPEWQSSFGGQVLVGGSGGAINSLQSWGPAASVIVPADIGPKNPVPAKLFLGYPIERPLANTAIGNPYWSQATVITAMVFPYGTRSVLFFGKHGLGAYCYGTGAECKDPADSSKGTHAYPYQSYVWAYDATDLLAVKNGQKQSFEIKPYAVWQLDPSFVDIQGVGYDPETQRLFVSTVCRDTNCAPIVRVYQINNAPGPPVAAAPAAPSNLVLQ